MFALSRPLLVFTVIAIAAFCALAVWIRSSPLFSDHRHKRR
jgi:hypothetical protein